MVVAASFLLLPSISLGQLETRRLRDSFGDSLGTLARANTTEQLSKQWRDGPKDFPHRAVYAALYSKLTTANSDRLLLDSMPSTGEQMEALYDAQDTRGGQDMAVTKAYSEYYPALADAVARHPLYLPQFLRTIHSFHFVDNVDEWPWLCGLASKIYQAHPSEYLTAVKQVEPRFRRESAVCKEPPDAP